MKRMIPIMNLKLEVVVVPVTDVDRARAFYEKLGFRVDVDSGGDGFRVAHLTPPGSAASIIIGRGITEAAPGSLKNTLVAVDDVVAARAELIEKGIDVSEVFHFADGAFLQLGNEARLPGLHPERASYFSLASFSDPDGNEWLLQEVTTRAPGR
jgi:catechol 2,3-dioxygenase-like lactoylglutathione lyase family enzyme